MARVRRVSVPSFVAVLLLATAVPVAAVTVAGPTSSQPIALDAASTPFP